MLTRLALSALLALPALAWGTEYRGALYTLSQTDDQQILVSALFRNGTVQFVNAVPTGGKGTGERGPDPLQSANGLVVKDNYLFAVNPASNDVSIFSFESTEPWSLQKVGQNVGSGGEYPTTLSVSPDGSKLAVANSGGDGSLRVIDLTGSQPQLMDFNFGLKLGQTNLPTPSDVLFSSNGQQLYLSVKGAANASLAPAGVLDVFEVTKNNITHQSTFSAGSGPGGLPFSMTPVADSAAIMLTDPIVGIDIIRVDADGTPTFNSSLKFEQKAACWSAYSPVVDRYLVADIEEGRLTWLSINSTSLEAAVTGGYNATDSSGPSKLVDVQVAHFSDSQDYLYSLSASDQVIRVFSLSQGSDSTPSAPIQTFDLGSAYKAVGGNLTTSIEGLAVALKPWSI